MKKTAVLLSFLIGFGCYGQKQGNNWYFGNLAGVEFVDGNPMAILDGQLGYVGIHNHNEGTSAISDSTGSLLFYSDGMSVWNKNHEIMDGGTGLLGNFSSTQSSIVVPDPFEPNELFYLFTVGSALCCDGSMSDGLRYTKIDMCRNNSLGAVISTQKNILLVDTVAEKIAVTRHANGMDYWVLTHKFYSDEFWALLLTANGIVDTVISAIGSIHDGSVAGVQGQLKFSPNGQKIAIGASNGLNLIELFDFDDLTGVVSSFLPLEKIDEGRVYGVEFSPDGSKLYTVSSSITPFGTTVAQYDLAPYELSAINSSLNVIYHAPNIVTGRGLQIGPNGKIYMVSLAQGQSALSVISNPNVYGQGCDYEDQSVDLGGQLGSYSLPGFIAGYDYSNGTASCSEVVSIPENQKFEKVLTVYPNPFSRQTTIESNKYMGSVSISVVNSTGVVVKELSNISGQTVSFNRDQLPQGLYFIRVTSGDQVIAVEKMIISD